MLEVRDITPKEQFNQIIDEHQELIPGCIKVFSEYLDSKAILADLYGRPLTREEETSLMKQTLDRNQKEVEMCLAK